MLCFIYKIYIVIAQILLFQIFVFRKELQQTIDNEISMKLTFTFVLVEFCIFLQAQKGK